MKKIVLLFMLAAGVISCSKEESDVVNVKLSIQNGNQDGVISIIDPENTERRLLKQVASGASYSGNITVQKDFLFGLYYKSSRPVGDDFKMEISVNGRKQSVFYLSELQQPYTYVCEAKLDRL